jgi:transposase-like protein
MTARATSERKREQAIAALLERPTITEAAGAVGIGEKTLRRWLAEPEFKAAYRDAREQTLSMAVGRLQALLARAGEALDRAMVCGTPSVEVRAAGIVIQEAFKGVELLDLAERVAALEKREPALGI